MKDGYIEVALEEEKEMLLFNQSPPEAEDWVAKLSSTPRHEVVTNIMAVVGRAMETRAVTSFSVTNKRFVLYIVMGWLCV